MGKKQIKKLYLWALAFTLVNWNLSGLANPLLFLKLARRESQKHLCTTKRKELNVFSDRICNELLQKEKNCKEVYSSLQTWMCHILSMMRTYAILYKYIAPERWNPHLLCWEVVAKPNTFHSDRQFSLQQYLSQSSFLLYCKILWICTYASLWISSLQRFSYNFILGASSLYQNTF